ncbi:MAG: glycosyltransferase family 8 protein [Lachnospiraceae bacterium]|jgi:Lipopolysaccharide biosynthesis proteins, LPS:glycosyltransferases|nr:glycosyltransferase family 8 protein [Lachnospiraceae bacterium]
MNIAIAFNEKFIRYGYVLITSIFENHPDDEITIYILHRSIPDEALICFKELCAKYSGKSVCTLAVGEDVIPSVFPSSSKWTVETYFRLALPYITDIDRILYLDTDITVLGDLKPLYYASFSENALLAGAIDNSDGNLSEQQRDFFKDVLNEPNFHYINAGVLLMDLEKLRKDYRLEDIIDFIVANSAKLPAFDQDTINYMFRGRIDYISSERFNFFARLYHNSGYDRERVCKSGTTIIHYSGPKPWSGKSLKTDIDGFWWDYARLTPYYTQFLEDVISEEISTGFENTNEFKYQLYLRQQLEAEIERLRSKEREYLGIIADSRKLLEKMT